MKKALTIFTMLFSLNAFSQTNAEISNYEFDNWDSETNPSGWSTFEDVLGPGNGIVQKEMKDVRNGSASLKLVTPEPSAYVTYSIVGLGNMYYNSAISRVVSTGTAYTSRPDSVWLLYKYDSPASDSAGIAVTLMSINNGNPQNILNVVYPVLESAEWKLISYPLKPMYTSNIMPDTMYVSFISSASKAKTPNSTLQIDGIYFNNPTGFASVDKSIIQQSLKLYPNPLTKGSVLTVNTSENLSGTVLHLMDASGKETGQYVIDGQNSAQVNEVVSGNYFWFITNAENSLVAKGKISIE